MSVKQVEGKTSGAYFLHKPPGLIVWISDDCFESFLLPQQLREKKRLKVIVWNSGYRMEILCLNKTIKFHVVGDWTTAKYIQISGTDSKGKKNCVAAKDSPYFSFTNGMAWTVWFSRQNFEFSLWNGEYGKSPDFLEAGILGAGWKS